MKDVNAWGQAIAEAQNNLCGLARLGIGKSRKGGENRPLMLPLTDRWAYWAGKLLESLLQGDGSPATKRALVQMLNDLDAAVEKALRAQERSEILRAHGIKTDSESIPN